MTAIVGVINSQGIAIAADSAVTISGRNVKKVYNRSNKIFTLSKFHPVGISIYNSSDLIGMPLETLIKVYRKELKEKSFPTLSDYKDDFLAFLKIQLKHVNIEKKRNEYFQFCRQAHLLIIEKIKSKLSERKNAFDSLNLEVKLKIYNEVILNELEEYRNEILAQNQGSYLDVKMHDYIDYYHDELLEISSFIEEELLIDFEGIALSEEHKVIIEQILFGLINIEFIFENHCGIIFVGFGEEEIYPSSYNILVGTTIMDNLRVRELQVIKIIPGVADSNIMPYVQGDVATTVLTGVDPTYKSEMKNAIRTTFSDILLQLEQILNNPQLVTQIETAVNTISQEFINQLEEYQWNQITGPLLEILKHMGKEDMAELAESLVNITSLKRKFTSSDSSDESVGGPVDVAIITKGDGFIWMKRKHYFEISNNPTFNDKYFLM